ncbi:MAG: transketolase family protein [Chloroflexota bacterium]
MTAQSSTVEAFGRALVRLGEVRPEVVACVADTLKTMGVAGFGSRFPERTFNFGIDESNMVMAAAGLSTTGKIPYVATYAVFLTMRTLEQIRTFVAMGDLNVKFASGLGGLSAALLGTTHEGSEDLALMRAIPRMTVLVPADATAVEWAIQAAADVPGPVYIRLGGMAPVVYESGQTFTVGKAVRVGEDGTDATIIAAGVMVAAALEARSRLRQQGIAVRVLDMHTLKPIDVDAIVAAARETGAIVTAEEHTIIGGLGGAVAEVLAERQPAPLERVGIMDTYAETGLHAELLAKYGLTSDHIEAAVKKVIGRKR